MNFFWQLFFATVGGSSMCDMFVGVRVIIDGADDAPSRLACCYTCVDTGVNVVPMPLSLSLLVKRRNCSLGSIFLSRGNTHLPTYFS